MVHLGRATVVALFITACKAAGQKIKLGTLNLGKIQAHTTPGETGPGYRLDTTTVYVSKTVFHLPERERQKRQIPRQFSGISNTSLNAPHDSACREGPFG